MKKVFLISNANKDPDLQVTKAVVAKLQSIGMIVTMESKYNGIVDAGHFSDFPEVGCEVIVVVGGDGSFLDASVIAIEKSIPILGVNLGKVGYLAQIDPSKLEKLEALIHGHYIIENKMLLDITFSNDKVYKRSAVNDVVFSHDSYLGIADIKLWDSEGNSLKYRSDGLILSTPQGSTAYSLSAGGPIIAHDVETIMATPVCPHSFFNRSVLFNAFDVITVKNVGRNEINISVDGRQAEVLLPGDTCKVERSQKSLSMITFAKNGMFTNLFEKMKKLEDIEQ